jgi:hypothetical protein
MASSLLSWEDLDVVLAMLAQAAPGWSAELTSSSPGESTIVVLPEGADDRLGPTFVLYRSGARVHLDQVRWDEYRELGGFDCLDQALTALRVRLTPFVSRPAHGRPSGT